MWRAIGHLWDKRPQQAFIIYITLGIIAASLCLLLSTTVLFKNLEFLTLDMLFRSRGVCATPSTSSIVFIEITSDDLQRFGHWPWPRSTVANLVTGLKRFGAKEILLDLLVSEPTNPADDDALAQALKDAGNVYLPFGYTTLDLNYKKIAFPIEKIRRYMKGTGGANVFVDSDGKVRRIPLFYFDGLGLKKSIILQVAGDHLGMDVKKIMPTRLLLGNKEQEFSIPLVEGNTMLLNWQGKWKTIFRHYSFSDLSDAAAASQKGFAPALDVRPIKNSVCILSMTALGLYDTRASSMEAECPGSSFIATALANIFDQNFLKVMPQWFNFFIVYLFAMVPAFYVYVEKSSKDVFILLFVLGALVGMYVLFLNNIVINFSLPFIALTGSYLAVSAYRAAKSNIERRHLMTLATVDGLTGLFNIRYFREILKNACWQAQKDPSQIFYLILCDIDSFKQFNDRFGHPAGDYLIEQVSKTIKNLVRSDDVTARYGGDEIILLLHAPTSANANAVAEKIRVGIENLHLQWEGQDLTVTVSLGMARFNPREDTPTSVIKRADQALLSAKNQGRNRVVTI